MATYGRPGQRLDFFDIDPKVIDIAFDRGEYFTFVEDAEERGVDISIVFGDARLTFEPKGEKPRLRPLFAKKGEPKPARRYGTPLKEEDKYGIIVVDAFSSDAIPLHLLTREALESYTAHLASDGVMLFHISNRFFRLEPVIATVAELAGLRASMWDDLAISPQAEADGKSPSKWMLLERAPRVSDPGSKWVPVNPDGSRPWTDEYSNPLGAMSVQN
jgi:hypothetical protein